MDFGIPNHTSTTRRYSAEQWEAQKSNIERLYITGNRSLKEVIHILSRDYCFTASIKQLRRRLKIWELDNKNVRGETMLELARMRAKRNLENKKSCFRVSKKPVEDQKIDRFLQRKDITEDELLLMASPVEAPSQSFSVCTPEGVRSPPPAVFSSESIAPARVEMPFEAATQKNQPGLDSVIPKMTQQVEGQPKSIFGRPAQDRHRGSNYHEFLNSVGKTTWTSEELSLKMDLYLRDRQERFFPVRNAKDILEPERPKNQAKVKLTSSLPKHCGRVCYCPSHVIDVWSCDICEEKAAMDLFLCHDHCPLCGHLRCPQCTIYKVPTPEYL